MSNTHQVLPVQDGNGKWYARCKCGWSTNATRHDHKWQCEDEIATHLDIVQRALAALHRSQSTMKKERDWAKQRLDDPLTPPAQRAVWQILYDGYHQRLNDSSHLGEQEELW